MKIRSFTSIQDGVYTVRLVTEEWSQEDLRIMTKFGQPTIDIGGVFDGIDESGSPPPDELPDVTYTLPTQLVGVKTDSPFVAGFDIRDNADAEDRARLWKLVITERISTAVITMRSDADTFTGEEVTTV